MKILHRPSSFVGFTVVSAILLIEASARADLIINPVYDSSVTGLSNFSTEIQPAVDYAINQFEGLYSDNIQINIRIVAGTTGLGSSTPSRVGFFTYTQVRNALIADAKTANDSSAIASLPMTDPSGGHQYATTRAQAKALGLLASDSTQDGIYTFNKNQTYTFDPNNRAVSGAIDFIGVTEHEISEIMGRSPGLGADFGDGGPDYLPFDLFRFTSPNVRNMTSGNNIYFSTDGGTTNLKGFNFPNGNGTDAQDWASGTNDAFNAFTNSGVKNDITAVDQTVMDVIGYDLTPEPATTGLLAAAGAIMLLRRRLTCRREPGIPGASPSS